MSEEMTLWREASTAHQEVLDSHEGMPFWQKFARSYAEIFNSHDVDRMYDFYAEDAVLVREPGVGVNKSDEMAAEIKGAYQTYFDQLKPVLTVDVRHAYQAGNMALLIVDYTLAHTMDGQADVKEGTATDVAVKEQDGVWRYAIDNPGGVDRTM